MIFDETMNVITLHTLHDVNTIIHDEPYISGKAAQVHQEIEHNMWCIEVDESLLPSITIENLLQFFDNLIDKRSKQIEKNNPSFPATLYVWFDKQALQLRFNILSNIVDQLPFRCTVHNIDVLEPIVKDFLDTARHVAQYGDVIEFIDDDEEEEEDDDTAYILDVFVVVLNNKA